jgi:hypothetical protein
MPNGTLDARIAGGPTRVTSVLPLEVRDARDALVQRAVGQLRLEVPAGLYRVRGTLPSGRLAEEIVQVVEGEVATRVLTERGGASEDEDAPYSAQYLIDLPTGIGGHPSVGLLHVGGAEVERMEAGWRFVPFGDLKATPFAQFATEDRFVVTSLPVNPEGNGVERGCTVTVQAGAEAARIVTGFARQRDVAQTLEGLIRSGEAHTTPKVLAYAEDLLFGKYKDPAAAALGGLTLHRMGRLVERLDWVENLARDFPWLPDGKVLLAATLVHAPEETERARGLAALITAAETRPMFTDGLALLLDLLRRWPADDALELRLEAIDRIAPLTEMVDWSSVSLTTYQPIG